MKIVIERQFEGHRRVRNERDEKLGEVWRHEPFPDGSERWTYNEDGVQLFWDTTLRALRRRIERHYADRAA